MSALEIGLKHLSNASKTASGLIDATVETKLQGAIIDMQKEIIAAQQNNILAQSEHQDLLQEVRALKAEIVQMKDWSADAERYEMKTVSPQGVVVYAIKPTEQGAEPPHELCPNCYANRKKSIMQPTPIVAPRVRRRIHICPSCQLELAYTSNRNGDPQDPDGHPEPPLPEPNVGTIV